MPAYNFKKEFSQAVEDGTKLHTIRKKRERPTRPGDTLYLYTGMRTKNCRLLRTERCRAVKDIVLTTMFVASIGGHALELDDLVTLALDDGFRTVAEFFDFFETTYGLPFEGELIIWGDSPFVEWRNFL